MTIPNPFVELDLSRTIGRNPDSDLTENERPKGDRIGGWLLLLAIGVIWSPLSIGYTFLNESLATATNSWRIMMDGSSAANHGLDSYEVNSWKLEFDGNVFLSSPELSRLLQFEFAANLTLFFIFAVVTVLFFRKSRLLPNAFIMANATYLTTLVVDTYFTRELLIKLSAMRIISAEDIANLLQSESRVLLQAMTSLAIWATYLKNSKRARTTFVE